MTDMVTPNKKIVLNIMHDESNNILIERNNSPIKDQEKLNKTITEYSDEDENLQLGASLEELNPEKNRQHEFKTEFKVFDDGTKMQIEEDNFLLSEKNFLEMGNEAKMEAEVVNEYNFLEINENNIMKKIEDNNIKVSEFSKSKILDEFAGESIMIFDNLKEDLIKQDGNEKKTNAKFINTKNKDVTVILGEKSSINLIPQNLNLFEKNDKKEKTKKLFSIKDNTFKTDNLKFVQNFSSNEQKNEYSVQQEEKKILQNFEPYIKKDQKAVFDLEFLPSDDSSNIDDNLNSGTILSNDEEEIDDENTLRTKKQKNSLKDKKFDSNYKTGRWTNEEHNTFIEAIFLYNNNWKKVQHHIRTRSSTQARSHAQKFFISLKKKIIEDLGHPTEEDINKEKNRMYLEESVETLFINKIYSNGYFVKDDLFLERKNKLLSLINTLLISNTKNKRSFFKCIDSKEQTKSRKNSLKRLKIKGFHESINTNEFNLLNSSNIKPNLTKVSMDESKTIINNENSTITRNNSNMNLLAELTTLGRNNGNFNSENSSMINFKSSILKKNGSGIDNNFYPTKFPSENPQLFNNLGGNNSLYYVNVKENKIGEKKKFDLDLNMNKLNTGNNSSKNQTEYKIATSYLNKKSNPNQILFLSQSYSLDKNGRIEYNNENKAQSNKDKEFLITNQKIEDLSFKDFTKKESMQNSNSKLIQEIVKIKSNDSFNSAVNLRVSTIFKKDQIENYNNLKVNKNDSTRIFNIDNLNPVGIKNNVNAKLKNNNFVLNNDVNKKVDENYLTIEDLEKSFSKDTKCDIMNNSNSDIVQESFNESFIYKENNLYEGNNKISLGKTMSTLENRKYENCNDDVNVDKNDINNNNSYFKHSKSDKFFNVKGIRTNSSPVNNTGISNFNHQKELNHFSNNPQLIKNSPNNNPNEIYNLYLKAFENKNLNNDKNNIKNLVKIKDNSLMNNFNNYLLNKQYEINQHNKNYSSNSYQNPNQANNSNIGNIVSFKNRLQEKEILREKSPYSTNNQNFDNFDFNNIEKSIKNNGSIQNNLNKTNNKINFYNMNQIPIDKGEVAKMKFQSFNIDLIQDLSNNFKSYGKPKTSDQKPTLPQANINSNKSINGFYVNNNLDKSRFLQIFNNKLDNNSDKTFKINSNVNFNDTLKNNQIDLPDKVLNQKFINVVNNQDFSKNNLLSNISIFNKEPHLNEYLNAYQKPNQKEGRTINPLNSGIMEMNFLNNEFKNKTNSKLSNNLIYNNFYPNINNPNSYQKESSNEYRSAESPAHNPNDFINHSKTIQNNNFTNLNHNNYINILNINLVHPKETNSNPSSNRESTSKQEKNSNRNIKDNTTTNNNEPFHENKIQIPKWNKQQQSQVLSSIPTKVNSYTSPKNVNFKSPAKANPIINLNSNLNSRNNNTNNKKSIFDDNIITIKTNKSNATSNTVSSFFANTKQKSNTNVILCADPIKTDYLNFDLDNNQRNTKPFVEKNSKLGNKSINIGNIDHKGNLKESRDDSLNPFNLNFIVEDDKRFTGNVNNVDCYNSYMNNLKEEDEFLGFDMFPN